MYIGNSDDYVYYALNGSHLAKVNQEKDLKIIISNNLKPEKHISETVKIANKLTGFIGRAFAYKSEKEKAYLRFLTLLSVPTWSTACSSGRLTIVKTLKRWREC